MRPLGWGWAAASLLTFAAAGRADDAVDRLVRQLRGDDALAAQSLGEIGKPAEAAIPRLKEDLQEPSTCVWAAYALLRITGDDAAYLPLLIRAIPNDANAADALGELGPRAKAAIPALIDALDNPSDRIRASAAMALGKMGATAPPAVPRLIRLLTPKPSAESGFWLLLAAAEALGAMGPEAKDAIPALNALANDDDDRLASAAEEALAKIGAFGNDP